MTGHPDRIELRGLRVLAHCGVLPEEQEAAADTPWVVAPDGRGLLSGLRSLLDTQ